MAASVARYVVFFGNQITMNMMGIDGSLAEAGTGVLMGFAFVFSLGYAGAWIAPSRKTSAALVLTASSSAADQCCPEQLSGWSCVLLARTADSPSPTTGTVLVENLATPTAAIYVLVRAFDRFRRRTDTIRGH